MLPEHSGGVFETATKGSRLAADILASPRPLNGLWFQQVAWGSSKSIGDTSSYRLDGWGANAGYDVSLGAGRKRWRDRRLLLRQGTAASPTTSAATITKAASTGARRSGRSAPGRAAPLERSASTASANFGATTPLGTFDRTAKGQWKGRIYSATGGLAYELQAGRFSVRPNVSHRILQAQRGRLSRDRRRRRVRPHRRAAARATRARPTPCSRSATTSTVRSPTREGWFRVELEGGRRRDPRRLGRQYGGVLRQRLAVHA